MQETQRTPPFRPPSSCARPQRAPATHLLHATLLKEKILSRRSKSSKTSSCLESGPEPSPAPARRSGPCGHTWLPRLRLSYRQRARSRTAQVEVEKGRIGFHPLCPLAATFSPSHLFAPRHAQTRFCWSSGFRIIPL